MVLIPFSPQNSISNTIYKIYFQRWQFIIVKFCFVAREKSCAVLPGLVEGFTEHGITASHKNVAQIDTIADRVTVNDY